MPAFRNDIVLEGGAKITGLPAATATGQPVTYDQLNSAVEGVAWKDSVRVRAAANVKLAAPGAAIDGVTMANGDRWLASAQTAGAENGIYIYNGSATPSTRAPDASTFDELEAAVTTVEEGTSAGSTFRQSAVNGTLGTTTVTWVSFGTAAAAATETVAGVAEIATQAETDTGTADNVVLTPLKLTNWSGRKRKAVGTLGDGSATAYTITHNFGTRDVQVEIYRNSGNYDTVIADITRPSTNSVAVTFAQAPTAAQFAYILIA